MSSFPEQLQKMKAASGFIAALDQSGGSTPNALVAYGIKKDAWSNDDEMFAIVHQMRTRIITSPSFTGARILGAILFENTIDRDIEAQPTAGIVINPATPAAVLEEILQDVEHVLVMTVTPGFGQQHFLNTTLPKIRRVREIIEQINPGCDLEVDGGIDAATAPLVVASGANVLVAGSAVFGEREGVAAAMRRLRTAVD